MCCLLWSTVMGFTMWKVLWPLGVILFNYSIGKLLFSKRHTLKNVGKWAIVTGATDGIGKAYTEELAKDGCNVMLISRNPEKLEVVAAQLRSTYGVQTAVFACDFYESDFYGKLEQEISKLPSICCLVNNVGVSYPYMDSFADAEFINPSFIKRMSSCNMISTACMTRIVLPILLKQECRGAAIINVGSYAGISDLPFLALYGATKAFVCHFTQALSHEIPSQHVILQSVNPLLVATSMSGAVGKSSVLTPNAFASSALDMLGVETTTFGTFKHAMEGYVYSVLPKWFLLPKLKEKKDRSIQRYRREEKKA